MPIQTNPSLEKQPDKTIAAEQPVEATLRGRVTNWVERIAWWAVLPLALIVIVFVGGPMLAREWLRRHHGHAADGPIPDAAEELAHKAGEKLSERVLKWAKRHVAHVTTFGPK